MSAGVTSRREFIATGAASALTLAAWNAGVAQGISTGTVSPFTFRASDAALMDLKRRLDQVRWPDRETGAAWEQGPPLMELQKLLDYWRRD